jgi:Flp pilus assembly pilin Flp
MGDGWDFTSRRRFNFKKGQMRRLIRRALREDGGQDLIEYGLLAAFISIIAVVAIASIGTSVNSWYAGFDTQIKTIPSGGS